MEAVLKCNQCEQALCQACSDSIHKKGARARHMREPLLAGGAPPPEQEDFREPCRICGRKFGRDRVYIHERICQKNKNKAKKKKLKVFGEFAKYPFSISDCCFFAVVVRSLLLSEFAWGCAFLIGCHCVAGQDRRRAASKRNGIRRILETSSQGIFV